MLDKSIALNCNKSYGQIEEIEIKLIFGKPVPVSIPKNFNTIVLYKYFESGQEKLLGRVRAPFDPCIEITIGGEDRFYLKTEYAGFAIIYNENFKGLYRFDDVCTTKISDLYDEDCNIFNKTKTTVKKLGYKVNR